MASKPVEQLPAVIEECHKLIKELRIDLKVANEDIEFLRQEILDLERELDETDYRDTPNDDDTDAEG